METNDLLGSLMNDPAMLQNAISMAASLFGGGDVPAAAASPLSDEKPQVPPRPTPNSLPNMNPSSNSYDPTADLMARFMPMVSRITQTGQQSISREKRALLNAIKPFVSSGFSSQIDHGMRLVMLAQMARAAMHPEEEGNEHV